jgi:hypothetical protein
VTPKSHQTVRSDLINFNFGTGTGNKKSSTAAFHTLTSSNKKFFVSESPQSQIISRIIEEHKTVKRPNRTPFNVINHASIPKMTNLEPDADNPLSRIRKNTSKHLDILDGGHAEPFEIIETSDFKDRLKESSMKRRTEIRLATPTNLQFDKDNIENIVQNSSFCESDFYQPKRK